jgi:peptide/nickel transport system ATP-binding protein
VPLESTQTGQWLLQVRDLRKYFPIRKGFLKREVGSIRAVDDVSFYINEGETLSLVGESGCGKTTTARCILRALEPTGGEIRFRSRSGEVTEVSKLPRPQLRALRREMQMIFQDPFSSLNPRMTLLNIVGEPLLVNGMGNRREREQRVAELLRVVGLRPEFMRRFPHAFSGGQRQRIGIARALVLNPELVIADEPVSALDVSVQAQILTLLDGLRERHRLSFLFVSHDLGVVRHFCSRVCVMYLGRIVETGPTRDVLDKPAHPYTQLLRDSSPVPDPAHRLTLAKHDGEIPSPANPPTGCPFHTRCPHKMPVCTERLPALKEIAPGRSAACHLFE